jgi:hypothetical protein
MFAETLMKIEKKEQQITPPGRPCRYKQHRSGWRRGSSTLGKAQTAVIPDY